MKKRLLYLLLALIGCWVGSNKAMALSQQDGVYQISSAADLEEFSNMVASGNGSIDGALTADIDMTGVTHQPIGTESSPYSGTFDGQEHYIMNMKIEMPNDSYVGLFGVLNDRA